MTYWKFTRPSPSVVNLPGWMRAAIQNSENGKQNESDDMQIGSISSGTGFCSTDRFKHQLYCACVNAPVANPECMFAQCTNNAVAYKTTQMAKTMENRSKECPQVVSCQQIIDMGGSDNVTSNIAQELDCGKNTFISLMGEHPLLVGVICIYLIIFAILLKLTSQKWKAEATVASKAQTNY